MIGQVKRLPSLLFLNFNLYKPCNWRHMSVATHGAMISVSNHRTIHKGFLKNRLHIALGHDSKEVLLKRLAEIVFHFYASSRPWPHGT
jgi:hypothetical protein